MKQPFWSLTAAALSASLLAACGGGGGSAPLVVVPDGARVVAASADSNVAADNYTALASPMVRAVLGGVSNAVIDPTSASRATAQAAGSSAVVASPTLVGRTVLAMLARVPDPARKQVAAVSTQTVPCFYGGSTTITVDDADNNGEISAGDSVGFVAFNCIDDPSLPMVNGGFTMVINAVELNSQDEPTALDVSATFQAFSMAGYGTMDGSFRLWSKPESSEVSRVRISYLGTTVFEPGGTVVYNFDVDAREGFTGGSYEISGGIGIGGRTYSVTTPSRLNYALGQAPSSGYAAMLDAAGDAMRIVARSASTFDLEFVPAGSSVPTASQTGLFWVDYED